LNAFRALTLKWPKATAKLVEQAANGAALIDSLQRQIPGIIPVKPLGSKTVRAQAIAPVVESGNVYLPDPIAFPWVQVFIEELVGFPAGKHDDQVDAFSQGMARLGQVLTMNFMPVSMAGTSKWLR
jgi:predicted phage terminase large subunit-like protein